MSIPGIRSSSMTSQVSWNHNTAECGKGHRTAMHMTLEYSIRMIPDKFTTTQDMTMVSAQLLTASSF